MKLSVKFDEEADTLTVTDEPDSFITQRYRPGQNLVRSKVTHIIIGLQLTGFIRNWTCGDRVCEVMANYFKVKPAQIHQVLLAFTSDAT